jgi:hypothetical protein
MKCFEQGNIKIASVSNQIISQIEKTEKLLDKLCRDNSLSDSDIDRCTEVSTMLNTSKLRIDKIRGYF